ncbi:MAG: YlmH/Sll1252 family protein [Clostridia bacterium]|nr:YlmH/Sll1252 family protein [Clostridia bacterium]
MTSDEKIMLSYVSEKAEQCLDRQMITESKFLDMHEKSLVNALKLPYGVRQIFYGGFEDAERTVAVFLPEYIEADDYDSLEKHFAQVPEDCPVALLEVSKDKFSKPLTHRDYLGALMGLGINREMTGDIMVNEGGCHIAVMKNMAEYIAKNMVSAGRGTLNINITSPWDARGIEKNEGVPDSFTVSSPRLDSIVKNGFSVSRDAACEAISKGLVFLNDSECLKPDKRIAEGDKITLRHKGRVIISSMGGKSKRGRDIINVIRFVKK